MNEWMDKWMDEWMNEWMYEWMNEYLWVMMAEWVKKERTKYMDGLVNGLMSLPSPIVNESNCSKKSENYDTK